MRRARLNRGRVAGLTAATLLVGMIGCGDGEPRSDRGNDSEAPRTAETGMERPAPAGRVTLDQRFPAIPVEPLRHEDSLLRAHAWTIVGLVPAACEACAGDLDDWLLEWDIWRTPGLRFVIVAEGRPDDVAWLDPVTEGESDVRAFTTTSPMFRHTGELSRPSFVLVDTMGVVRQIGRQTGTIDERWRSLVRNRRYQSAPDSVRTAIIRRAFPTAARVEIRRVSAVDDLSELTPLGLSPWFGVAYWESGELMGYGLPVERDTDCNTCDPLYLCVGVEPHGHVIALEEIEPVVSLGRRELTAPFFAALRGVGSDEDVSHVKKMLDSPKADTAVREILSLSFAAAARLAAERD